MNTNDRFKCKAWNKITKKMIDLYAITPLALDSDFDADGIFIPFNEDIIILQPTGLKDKNDHMIFVEDIIKDHNESIWFVYIDDKYGSIMVKIVNTHRKMNLYSLITYGKGVEIIGSVYENQELIKND